MDALNFSSRFRPFLKAAGVTAAFLGLGAMLSGCIPVLLAGGAAAGAGAVAQERSVGDGVDDVTTDADIKLLFLEQTDHDYSDVDITVYEGRVLLTGTARTDEARGQAAKVAWSASNVSEVLNELKVGDKTKFTSGSNDAWIEARLRSALLTDEDVTSINYEIAVSQGEVYLLGLAETGPELDRVTNHARTIRGVVKVVSHVQFPDDPSRKMR
ncbi:MAG: BON domain-containing protein [Pseudomonadota bacterium]